jgi:hypothetical protein
MRLDWNDIKARAAKFAADWKDAHYERGESQTFYNEFFELFGITRRRVASFEHGVDLPDKKRGFLDLFWKGKLLIEQKSAGRSLAPARNHAPSAGARAGACASNTCLIRVNAHSPRPSRIHLNKRNKPIFC